MRVVVQHLYGGAIETFEGDTHQVKNQLRIRYPWLARYAGETLQQDVNHLNRQQAMLARLED